MSSLKPKNSKKVYDKFWYIIDLEVNLNRLIKREPQLKSNHYLSEQDARNAIHRSLMGNTKRYDVISGAFANKYGFKIISYARPIKEKRHVLDYGYPPERSTRQKRKTYRTIMRRRAKQLTNPETPIKMRPLLEDIYDEIGRLYKRGKPVSYIKERMGLSLKTTRKGLLLFKITQL